jgi:hypothetical protein
LRIAEKSVGAPSLQNRVGQFKLIAREVQAHVTGHVFKNSIHAEFEKKVKHEKDAKFNYFSMPYHFRHSN